MYKTRINRFSGIKTPADNVHIGEIAAVSPQKRQCEFGSYYPARTFVKPLPRQYATTEDVTEDYYDTEIRLKNKELYLEKYRDFLEQAKTVKDMLEVQEKIRNMEEEIESAKGKLRFIDDKVNFSTLDINIYREKPTVSGAS